MPDLVRVTYEKTGKSKQTNGLGMREMQEKAYVGRTAQYLLLKAPPASGKIKALKKWLLLCLKKPLAHRFNQLN